MALTDREIKEKRLRLLELEEAEELESSNIKPEIETDTTTKESNSSSDLMSTAAISGGAAALGSAAFAGTKVFNSPQRQIVGKEKMLDKIKSDYLNEPFIASKDLPGRIQLKSSIEQQEMKSGLLNEKSNLQTLKTQQDKISRQLGDDLNNFDNTVLKSTVEDFGLKMKETFPKLVKQTYDNYGNKLNEFTDTLVNSGKALQANTFTSDVLEKTITDSVGAGIPEDKLGKLMALRDTIKSDYLNEPLSVAHLKGNVDSLASDLPQGAAIKLRDNWGRFLSDNAQEINSDFHIIQKDYSRFANMRDSLYDTIEGGEFNMKKMNAALFDFAKDKAETGLSRSVRLMAEGNNIVTGMPEINEPFQRLKGAVSARKTIQSSGKALVANKGMEIESSLSRIDDIGKRIQESKLNAMKWASKADQLLSEQSQIITKHPIRSGGVGRIISNVTGVAQRAATASGARAIIGRAIPPIQAMSSVLQAGEFISDPAVGWGKQVGVEVPPKGSKERFVLEEIINKKPIPPELNISEEEKFKILVSYGLGT